MKNLRTGGSALLALLLVGTIVAVAGSARAKPSFSVSPLTPDSTYTGSKSVSGALAETDPSLLGRTDSTPVNVLLKYDYDATASYAGGLSGLAATSPSVTGKKLKDNKDAVRAYEQHTDQSPTRSALPSRRRCRTRRSASRSRRSTAASRRRCRRTRSATC